MPQIQNSAILKDIQRLLAIASRRNRSLPFLAVPALSAEIRSLLRSADLKKEQAERRGHERMIEDLMSESSAADILTHGRSSLRACPRWLKPSACRQVGESIDTYIPRYFQKMDAAPELQRVVEIANGGMQWRELKKIYTRWAAARRRELAAIAKSPVALQRLRALRRVLQVAVATLR